MIRKEAERRRRGGEVVKQKENCFHKILQISFPPTPFLSSYNSTPLLILSRQPFFFPKLQKQFADFPELLSSMWLYSTKIGHLLRFRVRLELKREESKLSIVSQLDFQGLLLGYGKSQKKALFLRVQYVS